MNEKQYDEKLNIETEGYQIGYPKSANYHRYEPTPYKALIQLFEQFEMPRDACCVDFGCGKGRVPIFMYDRFHVKVKGVEMDPKFFAAAEMNVESYAKKHRITKGKIQLQLAIAEDYQVANEDNVFFFFNPFSVHIFRIVMQNIFASYYECSRPLTFIFYYPSPEYVQSIYNEFHLQFAHEIKLSDERNENERVLVFTF